jgi:hypothetical protein
MSEKPGSVACFGTSGLQNEHQGIIYKKRRKMYMAPEISSPISVKALN